MCGYSTTGCARNCSAVCRGYEPDAQRSAYDSISGGCGQCNENNQCIALADWIGESIDVYRLRNENISVEIGAVNEMTRFRQSPQYSYLRAAAAFLWSRIPRPFRLQREADCHGLICSEAVSKAYRLAGLDLCPCVPDWATTPEHIAQSPRLKRMGRLEA
jgi:hypothetical protein